MSGLEAPPLSQLRCHPSPTAPYPYRHYICTHAHCSIMETYSVGGIMGMVGWDRSMCVAVAVIVRYSCNSVYSSSGVTVQGLPVSASEVSAGYDHTCAALSNGEVMCWGGNSNGQLGNEYVGFVHKHTYTEPVAVIHSHRQLPSQFKASRALLWAYRQVHCSAVLSHCNMGHIVGDTVNQDASVTG